MTTVTSIASTNPPALPLQSFLTSLPVVRPWQASRVPSWSASLPSAQARSLALLQPMPPLHVLGRTQGAPGMVPDPSRRTSKYIRS